MARYNACQNNGLFGIVQAMDEDALRQDHGAFFGAIMKTLNHLLWGDLLWMSRFDGGEGPSCAVVQHRGQIHAILTAADQKPQDTDLLFMPER